MARRQRGKNYDRVSDYVNAQVTQLSQNYRRYRFVFLAIFVTIGLINSAVAALAVTAMVKIIHDQAFDTVGIITLSSTIAAILNLGLLALNTVTRYRYRQKEYASAYRCLQGCYASYIYGVGRYEKDGLAAFEQDVAAIVAIVCKPHPGVFRSFFRSIYQLEEE